jgi:hypothetical protein
MADDDDAPGDDPKMDPLSSYSSWKSCHVQMEELMSIKILFLTQPCIHGARCTDQISLKCVSAAGSLQRVRYGVLAPPALGGHEALVYAESPESRFQIAPLMIHPSTLRGSKGSKTPARIFTRSARFGSIRIRFRTSSPSRNEYCRLRARRTARMHLNFCVWVSELPVC